MLETFRTRWADWLAALLGAWLFLSPWALGFASSAGPAWNAWLVGIATVALALAALSAFQRWQAWILAVAGAWLIVSPWLFGFAGQDAVAWNHVLVGVATVALAAADLRSESDRGRRAEA